LGRRGGGYGDMRVKRREEKYEKAQDEKMGVAKLKNNPPKKKKKKNIKKRQKHPKKQKH